MASIGLCDLPVELLAHMVATYLTTKDLGALRLTCKGLERVLFDPFGLEFFTKKQFMLTTPSLQTLIDISNHGGLSKFLKHVIIGLEEFHTLFPPSFGGANEKFHRYCEAQADQVSLIHTGGDREMLAEAFRNLPNLETIEIRDYSATGRVREGSPSARWRSYGLTTIQQETGISIQASSDNKWINTVTRTFPMLIMAAADAGVRPKNLQAFLRHGPNLTESSFYLPDRLKAKIDPVLDGLQSLLLTVSVSNGYLPNGLHGANFGSSTSIGSLAKFLARTPNLVQLRLNSDTTSNTSNLLEWLGTPDSSTPSPTLVEPYSFIPPIAFAQLQRLDLGMTSTQLEPLLKLIAKFASTLRTLSLWKVDLTYQFGGSIPQTDLEHRPSPWNRLLSSIMRIPHVGINHLMLGKINQKGSTTYYEPSIPIVFQVDPNMPRVRGRKEFNVSRGDKAVTVNDQLELKGETAKILGEARERLLVNWPPDPVPTNSEDENSEDDEDNEDNEDDEMADVEPEEEDAEDGNQ
ncbi:hypothetical protein P154DRAFT_524001 [Amniculicola lignicola CBS 123094]|uniref:F-box domain-containing protein n=1 Tax=Amniculicola lignicola CBS 123094 TaxID=1392246 RepID=A0A6A5WC93_9PLEO|nr:hypothetical protein P154DRAFT_524001 [Amniculicola lignicola CBS 123094]